MDSLDVRIARYEWLDSQRLWHTTRAGDPQRWDRKWHRSQVRWYRKQMRGVLSITEMVSLVFRNHAATIVSSVTQSNTLLSRLKERHANNSQV